LHAVAKLNANAAPRTIVLIINCSSFQDNPARRPIPEPAEVRLALNMTKTTTPTIRRHIFI
jgi:hypothetical protein